MNEQEFSIQELCDQTGLPRRTIHFYTQQEIIPPPISSGLGARYQRTHLVRLSLVPILRQKGMRLDDIRQKFMASSPEELETLLSGSANPQIAPKRLATPVSPASPPPSSITPQTYLVYNLPQGVILLAPNHLPQDLLAKIEKYCQTFRM